MRPEGRSGQGAAPPRTCGDERPHPVLRPAQAPAASSERTPQRPPFPARQLGPRTSSTVFLSFTSQVDHSNLREGGPRRQQRPVLPVSRAAATAQQRPGSVAALGRASARGARGGALFGERVRLRPHVGHRLWRVDGALLCLRRRGRGGCQAALGLLWFGYARSLAAALPACLMMRSLQQHVSGSARFFNTPRSDLALLC